MLRLVEDEREDGQLTVVDRNSRFVIPDGRLAFDDNEHVYWIDGRPAIGVTRVLQLIDGCMFYTPEGRDRGKLVHRMMQCDVEDTLDIAALDDWLLEYYEGWSAFLDATGFVVELCEQPVYHKAFDAAGTLDLFGHFTRLRPDINGKPCLLDVKSGVVSHTAGPQTAAYKSFGVDMNIIPITTRRFVLDLKPGKWTLSDEYTEQDDKKIFYNLLGVARWLAERNITVSSK